MALFGLFGSSKKTPATKNTPVTKKVPAKRIVETTAGVDNTGVDVYSFPGTPEEYFAQVLARNFPSCQIRKNVAFADLYDPTGAVRAAARRPSSTFKTDFERAVANDMLRNRLPRLSFVIYQNGEPQIAILLSRKRHALGVISRTAGNNSSCLLLRSELGHFIICTSHLKGARCLQILRLKIELSIGAKLWGIDNVGLSDHVFKGITRFVNIIKCHHLYHLKSSFL